MFRPKRGLSYQVQLAVFPHLPLPMRLIIQKRGKGLPKLIREDNSPMKFMKLELEGSKKEGYDGHNGTLEVDSVVYTFEHCQGDPFVVITCSLDMSAYTYSLDLYVILRYFEHFLMPPYKPPKRLEVSYIQECFLCDDLNDELVTLNAPLDLKWNEGCNVYRMQPAFLFYFPREHIFERLELIEPFFDDMIRYRVMQNAKHLILKDLEWDTSGEGADRIVEYLLMNTITEKLEFVQRLTRVISFVQYCAIMLKEKLKVGSYITVVFTKVRTKRKRKMLKVKIVKKLMSIYKCNSKKKILVEEDHIVLKEDADSMVVVFYNHTLPIRIIDETYTVMKVSKQDFETVASLRPILSL